MDEIAAKQVLLDFQLIALITLILGVVLFALARKVTGRPLEPGGDFDGYDLVLMFFPSLLFLVNPLFAVLLAESEAEAGGPAVEEKGPGTLLVNIAYFFFV